MKVLFYLALALCCVSVFADPPGRAATWYSSSNTNIQDNWDSMTPSQRQQAIGGSIQQSDPFYWASLTQEQKQQRVADYERFLNQLSSDQRGQFLTLTPEQQQQALYGYYAQKTTPGDSVKQIQQQSTEQTYQFSNP